jgi:phosphatidylglycerophosphate synthase
MVVASLLMIALPLSSMIRPVFGLMTVLFALNDLYYYTGILWRARTRAAIRDLWNWFAASLPEIIAHGTSFIDNYRLKLRRPMGSDRIVTLPNVITLGRLALVPIIVTLIGDQRFWDAVQLSAIFVTLDIVDGYLARATGQMTRLGKVLDICVDKIALIGVLLALSWVGILPIWLVALAVGRVAVVGITASFLLSRAMELPRSFWALPADLAFILYAWSPSQEVLWLTVALNLQAVISYAYQASSMARQRG